MKKLILVLKNGYRFSGQLLQETETEIIIQDIKAGRTTIAKESISAKSEVEE